MYKNKIPSLTDIYFQDFIFSPGGTVFLTLVFNIEELPEIMPEKWKSRDVNAVQIAIEIVLPKIKHFELSTNKYNHLVFEISLIDNNGVKIKIIDVIGRVVLFFIYFHIVNYQCCYSACNHYVLRKQIYMSISVNMCPTNQFLNLLHLIINELICTSFFKT